MRPITSIRGWFNHHIGVRRRRRALTVAALRCIAHGWPVLPGAWWSPEARRHICDIPGCLSASLHPAAVENGTAAPLIPPRNLAEYALLRRRDVLDRWGKHPYSVLVPTGVACDAIELPSEHAEQVMELANETATAPISRVDRSICLFVGPGSSLTDTEIASLAGYGVLVHRRGSWVAMPPTVVEGEESSWLRSPSSVHWRLPDAEQVLPDVMKLLDQQ